MRNLGSRHCRSHCPNSSTGLSRARRGQICIGDFQRDGWRVNQLVRLREGHIGFGRGPAGWASQETRDSSGRKFGVSSPCGQATELPINRRPAPRTLRNHSSGLAASIGALHSRYELDSIVRKPCCVLRLNLFSNRQNFLKILCRIVARQYHAAAYFPGCQ